MELLELRKELIQNLKGDLPELVDKFNHFLLKTLPSKQNSVVLLTFNRATENLPRECVVKIFRTERGDNEVKILKQLKEQQLLVPKILFYKNPYLILEKVDGINVCDYVNNNLVNIDSIDDLESNIREEIVVCITNLAQWLANLHSNNMISNDSEVIVLNKGDTRLRDFVFNPQQKIIYGFDFEDAIEENHLIDISWICCALLDTNPGIFELNDPKIKIELINLFLKSYYSYNPEFKFNFSYFAERLIDNLNTVMRRRRINLSLDKRDFIKDISREV